MEATKYLGAGSQCPATIRSATKQANTSDTIPYSTAAGRKKEFRHPITCHEGTVTERELRYTSILSLTSALHGVGG